jgi:hypothetical protein
MPKRTASVTIIPATDLEPGDHLTQVGRVVKINRVGVFMVAQVEVDRWSLANGMPVRTNFDVVFHETEDVALGLTDIKNTYEVRRNTDFAIVSGRMTLPSAEAFCRAKSKDNPDLRAFGIYGVYDLDGNRVR